MEIENYKLKGKEWAPFVGVIPYYKRTNKQFKSDSGKLTFEDIERISDTTFNAGIYQMVIWNIATLIIGFGMLKGLECLLE